MCGDPSSTGLVGWQQKRLIDTPWPHGTKIRASGKQTIRAQAAPGVLGSQTGSLQLVGRYLFVATIHAMCVVCSGRF